MTLPAALTLANAGALIARAADKHRDMPIRAAVPIDIDAITTRLAALRNGQSLDMPELERLDPVGKWVPIGALKSHEAKATDWGIVSE